jgi:hypothetical protein
MRIERYPPSCVSDHALISSLKRDICFSLAVDLDRKMQQQLTQPKFIHYTIYPNIRASHLLVRPLSLQLMRA